MEKEFVIINNIEYVPKLVPDWDKLIELIDKEKRPERSVREFAAICNKSPTMFTKIIQKSYRKRLDQSFKLLKLQCWSPCHGARGWVVSGKWG